MYLPTFSLLIELCQLQYNDIIYINSYIFIAVDGLVIYLFIYLK